MKRFITMVLSTMVLATTVPLVAEAQPRPPIAGATEVRVGTVSPAPGGKYTISLDERRVESAYQASVRAARRAGRTPFTRAAFRAEVERQLNANIRAEFPRGMPTTARKRPVKITIKPDGTIIIERK